MNKEHTFLIVAQTAYGNDDETNFLPVVVKTTTEKNTNAFLGLMDSMFTDPSVGDTLITSQFTVLEWRGGNYPKALQEQFTTLRWDFEEEEDETKRMIEVEHFCDKLSEVLDDNCYN